MTDFLTYDAKVAAALLAFSPTFTAMHLMYSLKGTIA